MDQSELNQGICYRLYHFIMEALASQAMKKVTLGRSSHYDSSSTEVKITTRRFGSNADKVVQPETPCVENNIPYRNSIDEKVVVVVGDLPHAPKKMVSINDNVVEIILPGKKRIKSFQESNSLDHQQEHPKPLRSILKVGANLNYKSN